MPTAIPTDAVEVVFTRPDGSEVRWTGAAARVIAQLADAAASAAFDELNLPEPERSQPIRRVSRFVGRYRRGPNGEWIGSERPIDILALPDLLPKRVTDVRRLTNPEEDVAGNIVWEQGELFAVRVDVSAKLEEVKEESDG